MKTSEDIVKYILDESSNFKSEVMLLQENVVYEEYGILFWVPSVSSHYLLYDQF